MFNPERPPEITASRWLNSDEKRTLKDEKGKVVMVAVSQMTCPGSRKYGLPQAERVARAFRGSEVTVYGLHMAFEKFDEQTPDKVAAFLEEQGITIPVALDKANGEGLPQTMQDYELQGTPAILIFDRQGRLRRHYLGAVDDLRIGAEVMGLLIEDATSPREMSIAIERKLAMALVNPEDEHDHAHGHGCGCGHDHDHDHAHGHHHDHGHDGGCCGGSGKGECKGDGSCGDDHAHDHNHGHAHEHGGCGGGGCGCGDKAKA